MPVPSAPPALRPLTVGEILDRAFALYRTHFAAFLTTSLAIFVPLAMLQFSMMTLLKRWLINASPFAWCGCTVLLLGALTTQAGRTYMGTATGTGEALGWALRHFLSLLVVFVLTIVGMFLGIFGLVIGAVIVWVLLFASIPVVMLEGKGPFAAMRRSTELAEGDWVRIFLVLMVAFIISILPGVALDLVAGQEGAAGQATTAEAIRWAASTLMDALTYPYSVAATVVMYYDRRVRAEALDVQLLEAAIGA